MDAMLHLHGRMQRVTIHNISRGGMKLKDAFGLTTGDVVTAEFLSHHAIGGVVVWAVAPYTGIAFDNALPEDDPLVAEH